MSIAVCLAGCGDSKMPLAKATGSVTMNGQPVRDAKVIFRPEAGPAASGETDAQGHFVLSTYDPGDGAVIERHTVVVVPNTAGVALKPGQPPAPPAPATATIPPRFQRPESSRLTADVRPSGNDFSFDLAQ